MEQAADPGGSRGRTIERKREEGHVLDSRLERAERRLRALAIGWVATIVMFGLLAVGVEQANSQLATLRWRALEVADQAGRTRMRLAAPADGTVSLSMLDTSGRTRLLFQVGADGTPQFVGYDAGGRPVFTSQRLQQGGPGGETSSNK